MRIASWNCNGNPAVKDPKKAAQLYDQDCQQLAGFAPDVMVLQEVAQPLPQQSMRHMWHGDSVGRGIGIKVGGSYTFETYNVPKPTRSLLPIHVYGVTEFNLIAVWSRPQKPSYTNYVREVHDGLLSMQAFINKRPTIVVGDFNSNADWEDVAAKDMNHMTLIMMMYEEFGLASSYHKHEDMPHGGEPHPTFFMQRNKSKPYHIDYCFLPNDWQVDSVVVGEYAAWRKQSDHCPLVVDCRAA